MKPNLKYFHIFGSKCYVINEKEHLEKFDPRSDEGVFISCFENSRAYRIYNTWTQTIIEFVNVKIFDISDFSSYTQQHEIYNLGEYIEDDQNIQENCVTDSGSNSPIGTSVPSYENPASKANPLDNILEDDHELQNKKKSPLPECKADPLDNILSNFENGIMIRRKLTTKLGNVSYTSHVEPKIVYSGRNMDDRKSTSEGCLWVIFSSLG